MKKLFFSLLVIALVSGMVSPAWAAPSREASIWMQTSQGLVPNYPTGWAFAFPPSYNSSGSGVAFVGTSSSSADSGVFKSTDSGISWSGSTLMNNATLSLAVSPTYASDQLMVAGTAGDGVWKTSNNWVTPTDITSNLADAAVNVVAFSPNYASDQQLFAGTNGSGLFMTVNLGTAWAHIGPGGLSDDAKITGLVFTPDYATNHTLFIAATAESTTVNGVFKGVWSLFSGQIHWTWTRLVHNLSDLDLRALVISPNYANDHTLFTGTYGGGLFKSADSGSTWSFVSGSEDLYVQALAISPDYALDRAVYLGEDGGGVYRYFDSSVSPSVTQMNAGFPDPVDAGSVTALAFAPGMPRILFAGVLGGTDGGVWQFMFPSKFFLPTVSK